MNADAVGTARDNGEAVVEVNQLFGPLRISEERLYAGANAVHGKRRREVIG